MRALPSLSIDVILATYSPAEIDENIKRLKQEMEDLYRSASGAGKSGERDMMSLRNDFESFGKAKMILDGRQVAPKTQATFYGGPDANPDVGSPGNANFDGGSGI